MTPLQIDPIYFKYRTDQNVSVTGGEEPPAMSDSFVKNGRFWPFYLPQCRLQPSPGVFLVTQAINVGLKKLQTLGPATRW